MNSLVLFSLVALSMVASCYADCSCAKPTHNVLRLIKKPKPDTDFEVILFKAMQERYKKGLDIIETSIGRDNFVSGSEVSFSMDSDSKCMEAVFQDVKYEIDGKEYTVNFGIRGYALEKGTSFEICDCAQTSGDVMDKDICGDFLLEETHFRMNDVACLFKKQE